MLAAYLPIGLLFLCALVFAGGMLWMSHYLGPQRPNPVKSSPYECGVPPHEHRALRIPIRYYVVAMMFILFDIEAAFLILWAPIFRGLGVFGFVEMGIFIGVLLLGYFYVLRGGALEWE